MTGLKRFLLLVFICCGINGFAVLPATDSFTDANGTTITAHSASWTQTTGSLVIQSNSIQGNSPGAYSIAKWNADTFANDQYCQVVITDLTNPGYIGCGVRLDGSGNGYVCHSHGSGGGTQLQLINGGSTTLGSSGTAVAVGHTLRLEASGTSISCKDNGVTLIGPITDATFISGSSGVMAYSNDQTRANNWEGGNLSTPSGGATIIGSSKLVGGSKAQ